MPRQSPRSESETPVVAITDGKLQVTVQTRNGPAVTSRIQDTKNEVSGYWARTSRPCPKSCIQQMRPVDGIVPIGEPELLDMLCDAGALVLDSRTADWFEDGSIPGAINLPFTEAANRLGELECLRGRDGWDCASAVTVAMFYNGPWCGQPPTAIRAMVAAGFPAGRIHYYRDGMQGWHMLGLTTTRTA